MKFKIDSWDKCSINDYYRIVDINEDDSLCEAEKDIATVAVLCGVSEDEIYQMEVLQLKALVREAKKWVGKFEWNKDIKFNKIKIGDKEYEININLDKMNVEQYVDFQNFWGRNDLRKYYGNVLACFMIPKGHKYGEGYDTIELAEELRDTISIKMANEICYFFLKGWVNSIKVMHLYSEYQMKKMMKREKDPAIKMKIGRLIILNRQKTRLTLGSLALTQFQRPLGNPSLTFGN